MRISYLAVSAIGVVFLGVNARATVVPVTVTNNSFEVMTNPNGSCCGWSDFPDPALYAPASTWTAGKYAFAGYATSGVGDHFNYTPDGGSHFLYLANVGFVSQDLKTTVTPGETVQLNFWDGNDKDYAQHIGGGVLTAAITIGSKTISQNFDATATTPGVWISEQLSGIAAGGGDLSIKFTTVSGTPWLDDVSVNIITPEPASMGIVGMGMLAVGAAARRRR